MARKFIYFMFVIFLGANIAFATTPSTSQQNTSAQPIESLNSIAAIVNNSVITQSQLNKQIALFKRQLQQQNQPVPADNILRKQILNDLIAEKLQLQQAKKDGISISNDQVNTAINTIAAQNNISPEVLQDQVVRQGLSYAAYRRQIRKQLAITQAQRQAVGNNIVVTDQEVQNTLNKLAPQLQNIPEYHLQAILVPVPNAPSPAEVDAAKQRANAIIQQLNQGQDFQTVAMAESSGNQALQGGDVGWKQLTELPPSIASQISSATTGQIVGPIQTANGFYIFKIVGIKTVNADHTVTLYHVRHILLKQDPYTSGNEIKGKLLLLRTEILKGASFAKMAERFSNDDHTANKGGDLGWIATTEVPAALAETMETAPIGQLSEPIKTKDGWELFEVLGKKNVNNTEKNLANRIRMMIYERKFEQAVANWVQQLRGEAYIKIFNASNG